MKVLNELSYYKKSNFSYIENKKYDNKEVYYKTVKWKKSRQTVAF